MPWVQRVRRRLRALLSRGAVERELDDELRFHLEMETAQQVRRGVPEHEARRAALVAFGGVERYKEECRDARGTRLLEDLAADLRFAARWLRRSPAFTGVAVLTLALGVGGNAAAFSVISAVLLDPLPYREPERLVAVWSTNLAQGPESFSSSPPDFRALRDGSRALESMTAAYASAFNLAGGGEPERVTGARVSPNVFALLGVAPALGRPFVEAEGSYGQHRVLVLGHGLWMRRFGGDRAVLGRRVLVDGEPFTVVGVMPRDFRFPDRDAELWVPIAFAAGDPLDTRGNYFLQIVGRLAAGVTPAQAASDLQRVARAVVAEHPDASMTGARVVPLRDEVVGGARRTLLVLFGATALVLLIACANVANLLLARAAGRRKEIAVRAGLGASRGRLVRQLLAEALLLGAAGGALGTLVAAWGVRVLAGAGPATLPRLDEITVDGRVLAFTLVLSLLTALLFGLAPALQLSRADLQTSLRDSGRSSPGVARRRLRELLVASQVALALVLLIGSGLLIRSFAQVARVDPGFRTEQLLTMSVALPATTYLDAPRAWAFVDEVLERGAAMPGVRSVAAASGLSLKGGYWGKNLTVADRALPRSLDEVPHVAYRLVSADYFRAVGVTVKAGRGFTAGDGRDTPGVAVVNETLARRFWPNDDPRAALGKTIWMGPPEALVANRLPPGGRFPRLQVVGVVADERFAGLDRAPEPEVYQLYAQSTERPPVMFLAVRGAAEPGALAGAMRRAVWAVNPTLPVAEVATMAQLVDESMAERRFSLGVLGAFAGLALLLAVVGVYGVVAHSVAQRQQEIGLRAALGATREAIVGLVVRQGMRAVVAGAGVGAIAALALTRVLSGLLFGVSPTDPLTFAGIAALLVGVALLAVAVPAARASRIDPAIALRHE